MKMDILYNAMRYVLAYALLTTLVSCNDEEDLPDPSYEPGVWFYASAENFPSMFDSTAFRDVFSAEYTFYFHQESDIDTLDLPEVRLMGEPVDYDRPVNMVLGDSTTAIEGEQFELLNTVLPANAISFVPKVVLKNKNLGNEEKVIQIVLEPSAEFPAQILSDTISDDKTFLISLQYEVNFSNLIKEPPYWNQTSFKTWSQVKYEFMLEVLDGKYWGVEPIEPTDYNEMQNDLLRMKEALADWKEEHDGKDMLDEKGNRIYF